MTNLERQLEAAKKFEASKKKNVDLRANAREARESLDLELARAKQVHKDRRSGLDAKRAEASKEWARKRQEEEEGKKKASVEEVGSGYEYVYVDEDGNYYEGGDNDSDEDEDEDDEDEEVAVAAAVPGRRIAPSSTSVLAHGYSKAFSDDPIFTQRRNDLADFLPELQNKSLCLFRNTSHSGRLRDDHQVGNKSMVCRSSTNT
jgi:hypothetical protein